MIPASCTMCTFYSPDLKSPNGNGICRHHPPKVFLIIQQNGPVFLTVWPTVEPRHWCGDGEQGVSHDSLQAGKDLMKGDKGNGKH